MASPEAANPAPEGRKDCGMNKAERFKKYAEIDAAAMTADLAHWKARAEQAEVQLAGCSVAALGWATGQQEAKEGDYGSYAAYSDVVKLRAQLADAQEKNRELVAELQAEKNKHRPRCGVPIFSDRTGPVYGCGRFAGHDGPHETIEDRRAGKDPTLADAVNRSRRKARRPGQR